jgi:hypothetical protein
MAKKEVKSTAPVTAGANAQKAKEVFKSYPNAGKLYFTTDGLSFIEFCNAQNHAASLKDKAIETILKEE